jgi:hypothetical protein
MYSNCYHCPVYRGGSRLCAASSLYNFWCPLQGKEYKIRYESEYLLRALARALEGALAIDGP